MALLLSSGENPILVGPIEGAKGTGISLFYRTHQNRFFTWRREQIQLPKRNVLF
jgi:hypothetical protein